MINTMPALIGNLLGSLILNFQERNMVESALMLAYQMGVRDAYAQYAKDAGKVRDEQSA